MRWRVVCAFLDVMLIFWPTSAFNKVDLPTLGRPTMAMRPQRCETQRIPCPFVNKITPPLGAEIFRVIATTEPTDFSALFTQNSINSLQRGESGRGSAEAKTPFGRLIMSAMTGQTAGTRGDIFGTDTLQQVALPNPALTISSILIDVKPQ